MNTLPLGPFARDLFSASDTARALIGVLLDYDPSGALPYLKRVEDLGVKRRAEWERVIRGVVKQLQRFAPPLSYVGRHLTELSTWGVWADLGQLHRAEEQGRLIQSGSHPIKTRATYVLEHGGRGEVRLFKRRGWIQLWESQ